MNNVLEFITAHETILIVAAYTLLSILAPLLPDRARTFLNAVSFDADRFSQAVLGVRFNLATSIAWIQSIDKAHATAYEKALEAIKRATVPVEELDGKKTQQTPEAPPLTIISNVDPNSPRAYGPLDSLQPRIVVMPPTETQLVPVPVDTQDAPIVTTTDATT